MNVPSAPTLPWPAESTFWQRVFCFLKVTPLVTLAIYTVLSLALRENYPFSHYPMYSNPSPERNYYLITDGAGKPIPVATLTGITCPKIGKIFRKRCDERADKLKLKRTKLPQEEVQAVGMTIFQQLRNEAAGRGKELPTKLQLMRTDITFEDGKIVEEPNLIATE